VTDCVPLVPLVPVHDPDAVQLVASLVDQLIFDDCPVVSAAGLAEIVTFGGIFCATSVALLVMEPAAPVQVNV